MAYTSMLFALGFDRFIFGQTPGVWSIIGSTLILGSAIYMALQKDKGGNRRRTRQRWGGRTNERSRRRRRWGHNWPRTAEYYWDGWNGEKTRLRLMNNYGYMTERKQS
jgi:hypothetical protein